MSILEHFTPKIWWNCWIITNYMGAMGWWAYHKSPADVLYWFFAAGITAVVTFGYLR